MITALLLIPFSLCVLHKKTPFSAFDLFFQRKNVILISERRRVNMDQQKIGHFLKELRNEKKLTQAELAEMLGVTNRSISRWENGVTMPDFDLLIELAKQYDVEVMEILDGERKDNGMDKQTEELMLKVADYNNEEKNFFSKRMCIMFIIAITGMIIYAVIDTLGLGAMQPYESIVNAALGFVLGTLLTGLLYASRYMSKAKAYKVRLLKKIRGLQ